LYYIVVFHQFLLIINAYCLITRLNSLFLHTKPHAAVRDEKVQRSDHPYRSINTINGVTIRYAISKGGIPMDEKTVSIIEKVIGDTLYIVESAVSSAAKETAYNKLKRMILNDTKSLEMKAS